MSLTINEVSDVTFSFSFCARVSALLETVFHIEKYKNRAGLAPTNQNWVQKSTRTLKKGRALMIEKSNAHTCSLSVGAPERISSLDD